MYNVVKRRKSDRSGADTDKGEASKALENSLCRVGRGCNGGGAGEVRYAKDGMGWDGMGWDAIGKGDK